MGARLGWALVVAASLATGCGAPHEGLGTAISRASVLFDCNDPTQPLACANPSNSGKRFICHGSADGWEKIEISRASPSHVAGQAHGRHGRPDLDPGTAGLDCACGPRQCANVCTGAPDGAACDDGNLCTGDGACLGGICQAGTGQCAEASISPTFGVPGTAFVLFDPQGRMTGVTFVIVTPLGQSFEVGAVVQLPMFSADGTTVTGTVPITAEPTPSVVTVHRVATTDPPIFNGVPFNVL